MERPSLDRATLIIIDMQPVFEASQKDWMIENVRREIKRAKRRAHAIVVVRYRGSATTETLPALQVDNRILGEIGTYPHVGYVTKNRGDGSKEILRVLRGRPFPTGDLIVVGVNTDCCVAETVNSLAHKLPQSNIWIVADACNTDQSCASGRSHIARKGNIHRVNLTRTNRIRRTA